MKHFYTLSFLFSFLLLLPKIFLLPQNFSAMNWAASSPGIHRWWIILRKFQKNRRWYSFTSMAKPMSAGR